MRKLILKAATAGGTVGASLLAFSTKVAAYSYEYSSSDDGGALACLSGLSCIIWIPMALIGLVFFILNVWMIIDVLGRDEKVLPNKTMWLVLLIVGFFVGFGGIVAIYYYFARKKKLDAM